MSPRLLLAAIACAAAGPEPGPAAGPDPAAPEYRWRELTRPLDRWVDMVAFSPDGRLVAAGAKDVILVWAADTGQEVTRMRPPGPRSSPRLAFSPDGKTVVSVCPDDPQVRVWDVGTGKQVREWRQPGQPDANGYWIGFKTFARDGRLAAFDGYRGRTPVGVDLLEAATGRQVARVATGHLRPYWVGADLSPDGKLMATSGDGDRLDLWDPATGKPVRQLRPGVPARHRAASRGSYVRFSPDGRYLVTWEQTGVVDKGDKYRVVVWRVADGRRVAQLDRDEGWRVSADGRYLLAGDGAAHDLWTDAPVEIGNRVPGRELVGVSPDGKTLAFTGEASGREPGSRHRVSVYLTPAPVLPPPVPDAADLSPRDLNVLWRGWVSSNELAREFAGKALAARPGQAVGYAAGKVAPVPAVQAARAADLIANLDDSSPDIRDRVQADLRRVAFEFEPLVAAALAAAPPGEVRNRLTAVMAEVARDAPDPGPAGDQRRWAASKAAGVPTGAAPPAKLTEELRAVDLLAAVGTPEARAVLERVAAGAAGAAVTGRAAAALGLPR